MISLAAGLAGAIFAFSGPGAHGQDVARASVAGDPTAIVLLDATEGMALGSGESKFELQRHALDAMPAASLANVRFATFGGKPCGGFADIGAAREVDAWAAAAAPAGRRDLAAALEGAAGALPESDGPQRIVAVVGGPNQCLSAVCARVDRLKAARPNLQIDVIGFDLSDTEAERLHCVAANSGGRLLRADRNGLATTLTLASGSAVRSGNASPPPGAGNLLAAELLDVSAPAASSAYGLTGPELVFPRGVRVLASLTTGGPTIPAGARFELLEHDSNGVLRLVARTKRTSAPLFSPPPGQYVVRIALGHAVAMIDVEAPVFGIQTYRVDLNAGQVEMAATMAGRPISSAANFVIQRMDDHPREIARLTRSGPALATLPAGRYRVTANLDASEMAGEVIVEPGQFTRLDLEAPVGFLRIDGVGEGDVARVLRLGREVARADSRQQLFRLPTGAYRVEVGDIRRRVVVAARRVAAIDLSAPDSTQAKTPLAHAASVRRLVAERTGPAKLQSDQ